MEQIKKPKPLGACTICRAPTDQHEQVNNRCTRQVHGRRCTGIYRSDLSDVWIECESCNAAGKVGTQVCSECEGFGWRLFG